jgi:hypothetical protein
MKKRVALGLAIFVTMVLAAGLSVALAKAGKLELKVGDEPYVCNCGPDCPCGSMAMTPGKCTCGKDMVQAKVKAVTADTATVVIGGKEQTFKTVGKYACACGEACPCKMISQNPGNCTCGKEMAAVK